MSALCRSRRELSNAYLLAKIGVDAAENEPLEVWGENSIQYSLHSLVLQRAEVGRAEASFSRKKPAVSSRVRPDAQPENEQGSGGGRDAFQKKEQLCREIRCFISKPMQVHLRLWGFIAT